LNHLFKTTATCTTPNISRDRFAVWLFVISILSLVNASFFWLHYSGYAIFPWDFYGGYHATAYSWLQDGSLISPPLWSPYGNYGFPTHLAMQNSSFYFPLVVLDWLGISYTLTIAAIVQCLHILAGSIGFYFFLRLNKISILPALTGGILFHLSIGFFSNAQHIDIIRGYAITPWLLVSFSPYFLTNYKKAVSSAWITFLFLTASYPGIIITVVYSMLIYIVWGIIQQEDTKRKKQYICYVVVSGTIALMLACIKYLPLALQLDELATAPVPRNSGMILLNYLTAFFRFDLDFIRGDLTMRSYYLPSVTFILLFFTRRLTQLWMVSFFILITALLLVTDGPVRQWAMILPGISISRFPISDYRGLIHIALISMACVSLNELSKYTFPLKKVALRGGATLIFFMLLSIAAFSNGYQLDSAATEIYVMLTTLVIFVATVPYLASANKKKLLPAFAAIWVITLVGAHIYVDRTSKTWLYINYKTYFERRIYGQDLDDLFTGVGRQMVWPSRPDRFFVKGTVAGNIGYYKQTFSQTGYDNGLRLKRTTSLKRELGSTQGINLKNFLDQESQCILTEHLPDTAKDIFTDEKSCAHNQSGHQILMQEFGISHSLFNVDLDKDTWLLENELYFPGWKSEICKKDGCNEGPEATVAVDFLRSWRLPKGQYTIRTYYQPPLWRESQIIFWLAIILSLVLMIGKSICRPFLCIVNLKNGIEK
jgi:hypothetical protein